MEELYSSNRVFSKSGMLFRKFPIPFKSFSFRRSKKDGYVDLQDIYLVDLQNWHFVGLRNRYSVDLRDNIS